MMKDARYDGDEDDDDNTAGCRLRDDSTENESSSSSKSSVLGSTTGGDGGFRPSSPPDMMDMTALLTSANRSWRQERVNVVNEEVWDWHGDRGFYTGNVLLWKFLPDGAGRMEYDGGARTYDGKWRHGQMHGFGRATFSNWDTFDGVYVAGQRHGRGVYKWKDGRVYIGEYQHDKRTGKGTFSWPDGALYDGDFVDGERDGHGIYQFADGGRYEGGWANGRYNGVGTCVWADGRRYHGEWKAGLAHGQGIETLADGSIRHAGFWSNDKPCFVTPNEEISSGPTVMAHAAGIGISGSPVSVGDSAVVTPTVYPSVGSDASGRRHPDVASNDRQSLAGDMGCDMHESA